MTLQLQEPDIIDPESSASSGDLVTVLRLLYDYDYANQTHRGAVQVESIDGIERYGRIEQVRDARWLRSSRQALALATRLLQQSARPQWRASFFAPWRLRSKLYPGADIAALSHPRVPITGPVIIQDVEIDLASARLTVTCIQPVGAVPRVTVSQLSSAFEPLEPEGVSVTYRDGIATITILNESGAPLVGAEVTLNGDVTQISDANGRVQFSTPRGEHQLTVEAFGYAPLDLIITI